MESARPLLLQFGPYCLDEADARLSREGQALELQPRELSVLCELAARPARLVTKDELLDAVWGHRHVGESVLKAIVSRLRAVLDDDAKQPRWIETVSRRGYRFIGATVAPPAPAPKPEAMPVDALLVGRAAALERLQRALHAARQGRRQLLLVAGEPGIGKTRLIDAFVQALGDAAPRLARGQCIDQRGAGEPYMPVLDALDGLVRGDASLPERLRQVAPTWLAQLPWHLDEALRLQLQREAIGATPERMLREMGELLDRLAATQPLLLVLEDLHWSDPATVQLLGYLARRRQPAQLLVLGSVRPAEIIATDHPLAALRRELRLHRLCDEIELEAFAEAHVAQLLAARLAGAEVPEAFVQALHQHTAGLPLFVVHMLDELMSAGALQPQPGGWTFPDAGALAAPAHVVDMVGHQLARLPDEVQHTLAAASVAGVEFLHLPLAQALKQSPDEVLRHLDHAAAHGRWLHATGTLALPDGCVAARYAFRHALYRHVLYRQLPPGPRLAWHAALAEALDRAWGDRADEVAAELALHLELGGQPAPAARQLVRVARRALARSAPREALRATAQGLDLLARAGGAPDTELDLRVLEGVATTRLHVVSSPEVAAAFERTRALAERAGAGPARARALHGLWWVRFARGALPAAESLARTMLDKAAGGDDPVLRLAGHNTLGLTLAMRGQFAASQAQLAEGLALHDGLADRLPPGLFVQDPGVEARGYLALLSWWRGEPAASRRWIGEAVARAFEVRHPLSQVVALHLQTGLHFFAEDPTAALASADRLFQVIHDHDLPPMPGSFGWLRGHAVARLVDAAQGLAEMRQAEASCRALELQVGITGFHLHHGEVLRDAGDLPAALAAADEGLRLARERDELYLLSPLERLRAGLLASSGERTAARAALAQALAHAVQQGARWHELAALVDAVEQDLAPPAGWRGRLAALLPAYAAETGPLPQRARALLAA